MLIEFILRWVRIALRVSVVVTPFIATAFTLDMDILASFSVLSLWTLYINQALRGKRMVEKPVDDLFLLIIMYIKTMRILLEHSINAKLDYLWLLPLEAAALYLAFERIMIPRAVIEEKAKQTLATRSIPVSKEKKAYIIFSVVTILACGIALCVIAKTKDTRQLAISEFVIALSMAIRTRDSNVAMYYARMHLATALMYPTAECTIRLVESGMLLVGAVGFYSIPKWMFKLLTSHETYESMVLAMASVVCCSYDIAWYSSTVIFPGAIQSACYTALYIVDNYVSLVYRITSNGEFQRTFGIAIPEIGNIRDKVYTIMNVAYVPLFECTNGKINNVMPWNNMILFASLIPFALVALAAVLQVAPNPNAVDSKPGEKVDASGNIYTRSPLFWGFGCLAGVCSFVAIHGVADLSAWFWCSLFQSASYSRTYTGEGLYAGFAQLAFAASCGALFVLTSLKFDPETEELALSEERRPLLRSTGALPSIREIRTSVKNFIELPSTVCIIASVVTFLAALATGSPITKITIHKNITNTPSWVILTPIDYLSALPQSLVGMLTPRGRMDVLIAAMTIFALHQIRCWTCICVPASPVSSAFSFRRLLSTDEQSSPKRRLLEESIGEMVGIPCPTVTTCDFGMTTLCVADVVTGIVDEMEKLVSIGINYSVAFIADQIIGRIPYAALLDTAIGKLSEVEHLVLFDLIALCDTFEPRPAIHWIDFSLSTSTIVAIVIACVTFVLLLAWFVHSSVGARVVSMLKISAGFGALAFVITSIISIISMWSLLREIILVKGYDLIIVWSAHYYAFWLPVLLTTTSVLLKISEKLDDKKAIVA